MPAFPSLLLQDRTITPQGAFAAAQAEFFDPDPELGEALRQRLAAVSGGVVAHFYMDPEVQGLLYRVDWPHIQISDSLVMADGAIAMAAAGARRIAVLGVDFMSENVRAMLDAAGYPEVEVYRAREAAIGCSLAAAAETRAYDAYLERAAAVPSSLHVIYINTSLRTKAYAHRRLPTITCTSSNALRTVLQAFAQVPEGSVWFGPDTYMGANLRAMLVALAEMDAATIASVHPAHDRRSIAQAIDRFHYFESGNCVVHHLFGAEVVATIERDYLDSAELTAHLEVPGEMFTLALAASQRGRGAAGSPSDILGYIRRRVAEASARGGPADLRFILGTEAGMVTAIVHDLRETLASHPTITVEIIFPVASEAITITDDPMLPLVPGVAAGEGCSTAGGCATCPYMKMNSIDALSDLLDRIQGGDPRLPAHRPRTYEELLDGETVAAVGSRPILHMRAMQRDGALSAELVAAIRGQGG